MYRQRLTYLFNNNQPNSLGLSLRIENNLQFNFDHMAGFLCIECELEGLLRLAFDWRVDVCFLTNRLSERGKMRLDCVATHFRELRCLTPLSISTSYFIFIYFIFVATMTNNTYVLCLRRSTIRPDPHPFILWILCRLNCIHIT